MNAIDVFLGAPLDHQSEREFLARLQSDLAARNIPALILGNFYAGNLRQIDFLIVTPTSACHVELKAFSRPLIGGLNGPWQLVNPDGSQSTLDRQNPYEQARQGKFAISDSVRDFQGKDRTVPGLRGPAYKYMESALCIYPALPLGSQVPSNAYVRTVGYDQLLDLLGKSQLHPGWTFEHWTRFAMQLGLMKVDPTQVPESETQATTAAQEYRALLSQTVTELLPKLVPLKVRCGGNVLATTALASAIEATRNIYIVGPSGFGKSLLTLHTANALGPAFVPVVVNAKDFDARIEHVLDTSVASYHPNSFHHLAACAKLLNQRIVLIVDDLGGCPAPQLPDLIVQVQALQLRLGAHVVFTSKELLPLPSNMQGLTYTLEPLAEEERRALLAHYLKRPATPSEESHCAPFTTPFELSIAAETCGSSSGPLTKTELFDGYVAKCCMGLRSPSVFRSIARKLAVEMLEAMRSRLALGHYTRIAEPVLAAAGLPVTLMDDFLRTGLLEQRLGHVQFRHEQLEHLLQAEAVVLQATSPEALAQAVVHPKHRHLSEPVLGLLTDEPRIAATLDALAQPQLYDLALRGSLGELARRVASTQASSLLRLAIEDVAATSFQVTQESEGSLPFTKFTGQRAWSAAEIAIFCAVGALIPTGLLVNEVFALAKSFDDRCSLLCEQYADGKERSRTKNVVFHAAYVVKHRTAPPISYLTGGLRLSHFSRTLSEGVDSALMGLGSALENKSPGELYLLCELAPGLKKLIPEVILPLFQAAWGSKRYNLKLNALDMLHQIAHRADADLKERIVHALEAIDSSKMHIMLSTQLIDVLNAYGAIELPVSTEEACAEGREILSALVTAESREAAYHWVGRIFEGIFGSAYYDAFESLSEDEQVRLLTAAALGSPQYGSHTDWCLAELVRRKNALALPAFEHWATKINTQAFSTQEAASAFMYAYVGAAQLLDEPPRNVGAVTKNELAWFTWGQIVFWHNKLAGSPNAIQIRCQPLWTALATDLRFEALDPLNQFLSAIFSQKDRNPVGKILLACKAELLPVLHFSLRNMDALTGIFTHDQFHRPDRNKRLIELLGMFGTQEAAELLRPLADTADLGVHAVEAIKNIQGRPSSS